MNQNNITGNPAQLRAIEHGAGAACVIAGPGSGKTYVIIKRVIRLIEKGISPNEILVITFTKAAAITMQHRFTKETQSMYPEVLFGTFHSCFYQILKSVPSARGGPLTIITEKEKYSYLSKVLIDLQEKQKLQCKSDSKKQISCDVSFDKDTLKSLLSEISKIKNEGEEPSSVNAQVPMHELFPVIYSEYTSLMKEQRKIDFDDMVLLCHELLQSDRDLLIQYQNKFRYILIDEYQDINRMQFEVVRLLCGKENNLFVVGDDDQAIYGFRGSRPEFMLEFKNYFPEAKEILLDVNYRCGGAILDASLKVIAENKKRFIKDIKTGIPSNKGTVIGLTFDNKKDEQEAIVKLIKGQKLSDIAIIFRTNMEATSMAQFLLARKIPCSYKERAELFHEKDWIQTVLSYLKFACDGQARSDFLKIMNKPLRYFSRDCAENVKVQEKELIEFYRKKGRFSMLNEVQKLFRDVQMVKKLKPKYAAHYVRKVIGVDKYFKDKYVGNRKKYEEIMKDMDELLNLLSGFSCYNELSEYLEEQELIREEITKDKMMAKDGVQLMTMHASKGLEYNMVILPDLNEGIVPSRKSIGVSDIEEERRMLYVAMTRAKEKLYMTYVNGTADNPMRMSGFLRPIRNIFDDKKL